MRSPASIFDELVSRTPLLTPEVIHRPPLCAAIDGVESAHIRCILQLLNDDFQGCQETISLYHGNDNLLKYMKAVCLRRMLDFEASFALFEELHKEKYPLIDEIYKRPLTYNKFLDKVVELEIRDNNAMRYNLEAIQFSELKILYKHALLA
ncbi:hypothetical protein E3P92_03756 [Wallemia ichthyophaga]|nr:hypothetical protein E3P95_03748 [Wallemia ichthyophaga]TIA96334.1 hypothetical protein E3P94_03744 [Wallemia ichthyophaga]TIB08459.1 hypothetical protein E3P92_03756 [Wallemia ichthyophaga]TIB29195.1 hypothetical protein E3P84_03795 [Wallemia ichthyophaga]TIB38825.1 hypothetical protein E3P83_03801 [Wallemia ichthyophaga]